MIFEKDPTEVIDSFMQGYSGFGMSLLSKELIAFINKKQV
jgi:hypothetical protein